MAVGSQVGYRRKRDPFLLYKKIALNGFSFHLLFILNILLTQTTIVVPPYCPVVLLFLLIFKQAPGWSTAAYVLGSSSALVSVRRYENVCSSIAIVSFLLSSLDTK